MDSNLNRKKIKITYTVSLESNDAQLVSESLDNSKNEQLGQRAPLVQKILNSSVDRQNLRNTDSSNNKPNRINLSGADMSGADLSCTNLSYANLSSVNLSRADLSCANLSCANLIRANLVCTNLSCANLSCANLIRADLIRADLSGADLSGADLSCADLTGVDLSGTDLSGTDLSGATVKNACFEANAGLTEDMKLDLIRRGAIFAQEEKGISS